MMTTVLCYSATLGANVTDYGTPFRVDMGNVGLSSFVGSHLNDPDALRRVAAQWRGGTTASLRGLRIAHNDLQHGNIMVQGDGNIRLVDYDGMFLPQFGGERSPELGHKNFQHPLRTAEDYDAYVDNFPTLVIYLSLLAIASDPSLWSFYNDDNLIFTRNDYADPGSSEILDRLKSSPDLTVAKLTERLEECCALPVEEVPDLETILHDIPPSTAPSTAAASSATPPPSTAPAATGQGYRQVLQAQRPVPVQPTAPRAAGPAPASQPATRPTTPPASSVQTLRCSTCNRTNNPSATSCANCGTVIVTSTSLASPSRSTPGPGANLSVPTTSAKDLLNQLKHAAANIAFELRRNAASGELRKVILGVVTTVVAVITVIVLGALWTISRRGW